MGFNKNNDSFGITGGMLEKELLGRIDEKKYAEEVAKKNHKEELKNMTPEELFSFMNEVIYHTKEFLVQEMKEGRFKNTSYEDREALVENAQFEGNTDHPSAFFARSVYDYFKSQLQRAGFIDTEGKKGAGYSLKYFCAVGSHLDYMDGIDAFFKVYDADGQQVSRITLDVTKNSSKRNYKADMVILFPGAGLDPKEDEKEYKDKVLETMKRIASKFNDDHQKYIIKNKEEKVII